MHTPVSPEDDGVGFDLDVIAAAMTPARRRRFHEQLAGVALQPPIVPSGLKPFLHLPAPERATLTRARMAATIAERVAANGNVSRDDLLGAGFDDVDIQRHFREALRCARVDRMAV